MLARITPGWAKIAVLFVYLCVQLLVLAALLLTTTSMAVHLVFLLLTVALYFITALKEPGFYSGPTEQNHQDAQLSTSKPPKAIKLQRTGEPQIENQPGDFNVGRANRNTQTQQEHEIRVRQPISPKKQESVVQSVRSASKKHSVSIEDIVQPKQDQKGEPNNSLPGQSIDVKKKSTQKPRFKLIEVAKSMFESFAAFKSVKRPTKQLSESHKSEDQHSAAQKQSKKQITKKENLQLQKEKQAEQDLDRSVQKEENEETLKVPSPTQEEAVSSIVRGKACNSAIGKEDFILEHIQAQLQQDKIKIETTNTKIKSIISKIQKIKRYCRICSAYQPLRVKHCHSCEKCIATFDHHCPWLSNCIGEKNKLFFLLYLIFQTLQLLTIVIDLCRHLANDQPQNSTSQGILLMATLLFFLTLAGLLVFHLYLFAINLTTWQFLKWNQIEYLSLFDKSKLSSPFTKGLWQNLKQLWSLTKSFSQKNWIEDLSQDLSQFIVRKGRSAKSQAHVIDSDRRPFRSQKAIL